MADLGKALMVFTGKSRETILREGGTASWHVKPQHAGQCEYAVCTRNSKISWVQGKEPHGTAFLIGRVKDVVPTPKEIDERTVQGHRFLIRFSEYALVSIPNVWRGDRVPTRYMDVNELGLDLDKLEWRPMPDARAATAPTTTEYALTELSIAEAKPLLARKYGVPPDAIEITIRG